MEGSLWGNVLAAVYYLVFQLAGIYLFRRLVGKRLPDGMNLLLGSVMGTVLLQWVPVLFAFFLGFSLTAHILALVLVLGIAVFVCLLPVQVKSGNEVATQNSISWKERLGFLHKNPGLLLLAAVFVWFAYCLHTHTLLMTQDGSIHTGQATYGDMNMHLGFITSLARQQDFPPDYSIYPGLKLSYPFLCDSVSASLYLFGASLRFAYILPMLVAILQVFAGFYHFVRQWLGSRIKAWIAWGFYFLNGGLGFIYFASWDGLWSNFTGFYTTPTNLVDKNIRWVQIMVDMFIPQRATLFGFAVLFPLLAFLYVLRRESLQRKVSIESVPQGECKQEASTESVPQEECKQEASIESVLQEECKQEDSIKSVPQEGWQQESGKGLRQIISDNRGFLLAGILTGALPMIHTHSFLALGLICIVWLYFDCREENGQGLFLRLSLPIGVFLFTALQGLNQRNGWVESHGFLLLALGALFFLALYNKAVYQMVKSGKIKTILFTWGLFLVPVLLLALPQLFGWTFSQADAQGFLHSHFNWANEGDGYIWFYVKNIGIVALLLWASHFFVKIKLLRTGAPYLLIWFVAELVVFQPNNYDNNKLLFVGYVFVCGLASEMLVNLFLLSWRKSYKVAAGICIAFVALASAVLTMGREWVSDYQLYDGDSVEACRYIEEKLPVDAVFLTANNHNNAVASLTGRNIVCGSDSFLYYHGISTWDRLQEVEKMFSDPLDSTELFDKYSVGYILVSDFERGTYQIDEDVLRKMAECIYENGSVKIYQIQPAT